MSFRSKFLRCTNGWVAVSCLVRLGPPKDGRSDWEVVYNEGATTTATDEDVKMLTRALEKTQHIFKPEGP